jgi:4-amino-4-deoxy-L-arabinose transferase-like glycosyltransferase
MFNLRKWSVTYGVLLVLVVGPLFFLGLSNHGLWTADEPREAEIGREMALSSDWAVPTLNQKPFLEKPPLYYWSLGAVFKLFGKASDHVARIPSALFGIGGTLAIFFLARMLYGSRVGFLSAFILATSFEYFRVAHWVLIDSMLTCLILLAMTFFMAGYLSARGGRRLLFYSLFYLFCGLAFLSKGFIGLVLPGLGILAFLAFDRNLKTIRRMYLWVGALLLMALVMPWLLALWHQGGMEYLRIFFIKNHLQRFIPGGYAGHHRPLYYYLMQFPMSFMPWSLLLVPVVYWVFSKWKDHPHPSERGLLFLVAWFVSGFLFLSLASTKRGVYLLPIFAPFAILTACYIDSTLRSTSPGRVDKVFLWVLGLFVLGTSLSAAPLLFYLSKKLTIPPLLFSVLMVGLSVILLTFLWRWKSEPFWITMHGAIFSVLIFSLLWVVPSLDLYKSFVPFCEEINRNVSKDETLWAYSSDETLRGVVPFYTGRFVTEIKDQVQLQEILKNEDQVFIVAMDKRRNLEKELLSAGSLFILVRQDVGGGRVCLLLTSKRNDVSRKGLGISSPSP